MSDVWNEFSSQIKTLITAREDFTAEFYIDNIPGDTEFPYAVLMEGSITPWMTMSNVTAGEEISFRVMLTNNIRSGGAAVLRAQTDEVLSAIHLKDFETDEFLTLSCRRTGMIQPTRITDDTMQFSQYVDFLSRIQYKADSNYFKNFS